MKKRIFTAIGANIYLLIALAMSSDTLQVNAAALGADICGTLTLTAERSTAKDWEPPVDTVNAESTCVYTINTRKGDLIELTFVDFKVGSTLDDCSQGFVKVEEMGADSRPTELKKLCGPQKNVVVKSTTSSVTVTIDATANVNAKSFKATYKAVQNEAVCGAQTLSDESGNAKDWEPPVTTMPLGSICEYTISTGEGSVVELTFVDFKVGSTLDDCSPGFVKVEEMGADSRPTELKKLCGPQKNVVVKSTTSSVTVTIDATAAVNAKSFKATYKADKPKEEYCGTTSLTAESGNAKDWEAPSGQVPAGSTCVYTISATEGDLIELTFVDFKVGSTLDDCSPGFVKVEEMGADSRPTELKKLCGPQKNVVVKSTTSSVTVTIDATAAVNAKSFKATYKAASATKCTAGLLVLLLTAFVYIRQCV